MRNRSALGVACSIWRRRAHRPRRRGPATLSGWPSSQAAALPPRSSADASDDDYMLEAGTQTPATHEWGVDDPPEHATPSTTGR